MAARGAVEAKGETEDVRVTSDATHGVLTDDAIHVCDQVREPISTDVRAVLLETACKQRACFPFVYDLMLACRHVPVEEPEWGRLGWQIEGAASETTGADR